MRLRTLALFWCLVVLPLGGVFLTHDHATAQEPATCEDQARILRVLIEQRANATTRLEVEAATTIAELQKQLLKARAELEAAKKGQ